jgi:hypothetical protein
MNGSSKLAALDAVAQAELVKTKEVEPIELVEAAIERIDRLNLKINAVIRTLYDQAREQVTNLPEGRFSGVPILLKDSARVEGVSTTSGAALLRGSVSDRDAVIVKKMRESGLVFLGITNMPEFGILCTTEPRLYGPTRNPWDLSKTPGGSSGGAAAAVASGMVAMAHGGDGGGSIRIPSSCCGLFGMKLSRGRESVDPDMGEIGARLISNHVLTKSGTAISSTSPREALLRRGGREPGGPQDRVHRRELHGRTRTQRLRQGCPRCSGPVFRAGSCRRQRVACVERRIIRGGVLDDMVSNLPHEVDRDLPEHGPENR